jgi:signal transduction histidine kinase
VLSNLIGNGLKFTPAGGEVRLSARHLPHDGVDSAQSTTGEDSGGSAVEIIVEDTGAGIPSEYLTHVFDRFWQADRQGRAGAGLGLAIVKGIVEAHGGYIRVGSVVGAGTTFSFTVPVASNRRLEV